MAKPTALAYFFGFLLRVVATLELAIGIGFITFGCILQTPPTQAMPGALVGIGVITLIGSAFGYAGAQYSPLFLTIYLVIGAITNLCQFVVVIAIFGAQEQVLDHIQALDDQQHRLFNRTSLDEKVSTFKWIFLWIVLVETASLVLAGGMRHMGGMEGRYENMEQGDVDRMRVTELQGLGGMLASAKNVTSRGFGRVASSMNRKYGQHSQVDFMAGRRWYNIFRS